MSTQAGKSQGTVSTEPSPIRSAKKAKGKSTEGGDIVAVPMPSDGSAYSDPSFVKDATATLLGLAHRRAQQLQPCRQLLLRASVAKLKLSSSSLSPLSLSVSFPH